jgi:hypothetical protein
MNKNSSEVNALVADILSQTADMPEADRKKLAGKWKQAARGHVKNASYFAKQGQFTRKKQEEALSVTYDAVAAALEEAIGSE